MKTLFSVKDKAMPRSSKVHKMYKAMVREGMEKGKAARIAQSRTGRSLMTGRAPKTSARDLVRKMRGK